MVQGGNENLLRGINFAALVMEGVELETVQAATQAVEEWGATMQLVSAANGEIKGAVSAQAAQTESVKVQLSFEEADPKEFSAVLIPGGQSHAGLLRQHPAARQFIAEIMHDEKPVAACGEGIGLLIDAGLLTGRTVAGPAGLKNDLIQAGANWSDKSVEVDGLLITCAGLEQLDEFIPAMLAVTGNHVRQNVKGTPDEKTVVGPSS